VRAAGVVGIATFRSYCSNFSTTTFIFSKISSTGSSSTETTEIDFLFIKVICNYSEPSELMRKLL
jgi:hypothetical protein